MGGSLHKFQYDVFGRPGSRAARSCVLSTAGQAALCILCSDSATDYVKHADRSNGARTSCVDVIVFVTTQDVNTTMCLCLWRGHIDYGPVKQAGEQSKVEDAEDWEGLR